MKIRALNLGIFKGRSPKERELRYRRVFEAAQDGIMIVDATNGSIEDVNPYLLNLLGYSRSEFVQRTLWEVGAFKELDASQQAFIALQEQNYIRYQDLHVRAKDGHLVEVEFIATVYKDGKENLIQCDIRDISSWKQAQDDLISNIAYLHEQATRDHLTGLFNRGYFEETLERELARATRNQTPVSLIMLDVDDFKQFNDNCGHVAGDTILRELGSLVRTHVRRGDVPCRYGGDEFIIVLPDSSVEAARERAALLVEESQNFMAKCDGHALPPVTISVGVAAYPENGFTSTALLKSADQALYQAKQAKHAGFSRMVPAG